MMEGPLRAALTVVITALFSHVLLQAPLYQSLLFGITTLLILLNQEVKKSPSVVQKIPSLGYFSFLFAKDYDEYAYDAHQRFGSIVKLRFGRHETLSVGDYDMMKELSIHPELQLRPHAHIMYELSKGLGLLFSDGNQWRQQRLFVLHSLKKFGMGQLQMQDKIHNELAKVFEVMEKSEGTPMDMKQLFDKSMANIIFALAFNKQFDYDDEVFMTRLNALNGNFKLLATAIMYGSFPGMNIFLNGVRNKINDNIQVMHNQSREFIEEHKAGLDSNNPRDLLDLFLIEMNKSKVEDGDYHKTFFEEQLSHLIIDIFSAGTETSSTTILWALLYMIHHPEIQEKVRREIDDIVGAKRRPNMKDKLNLPYTVATLQEVERLGSVGATSLSRCNGKTIKFRDYTFLKGTKFVFSLYSIHRDPKLWKEPFRFNPSRFIDSDGKVFRPPHLVPFGSGKRSCVGESLAKMEIFLYFATLMQNFVFEAPDKDSPPNIKPKRGFVRSPTPYQIVCHRRKL